MKRLMVVDALNPPRVTSRNPFFDILIAFQNVPRPKVIVPGLSTESVPVHNGTCKFDIELTLEESDDGRLVGRWEYDSELFNASMFICRMNRRSYLKNLFLQH